MRALVKHRLGRVLRFYTGVALLAAAMGATSVSLLTPAADASFCNFQACDVWVGTCFHTDADAYCFGGSEPLQCWSEWCWGG